MFNRKLKRRLHNLEHEIEWHSRQLRDLDFELRQLRSLVGNAVELPVPVVPTLIQQIEALQKGKK